MSNVALLRSAADLGWSLWTELGVPGVIRNHRHVAIDLEPLVVATAVLGTDDPRLVEQALCWCAVHSDRVNVGRLSLLARALPPTAKAQFEGFAAAVNAIAGTRWPTSEQSASPLPRVRAIRLPLERDALFRLRARALCGVGGRADVLCDLLARPGAWFTAAELARHGHSKRNVARVLAEFADAGLAHRGEIGNVARFRLANPGALSVTLAGVPAVHPDWSAIFGLVTLVVELVDGQRLPEPVRRVEANTRREVLAPLTVALGLATPPATRGVPDASDVMLAWAEEQLSELAAGTSPALGLG